MYSMIATALQVTPTDDVAAAIKDNAGSDLYVLPEMWTTGFTVDPQHDAVAEPFARERMVELAIQSNAAVAGSIAVEVNGEYRNRFYFAMPDEAVCHYDKHHLFTLGHEHEHYTAGQQRSVIEWQGVRFLLLVCYDLRFPVWARNCGDYDCILYVANWPTLRIEAWRTLLRARAIENQCYVIGVNRISTELTTIKGKQDIRLFGGCSAIIDPEGTVLKEASAESCEAISAPIDIDTLVKLRHKFAALNDRDDFIIKSQEL